MHKIKQITASILKEILEQDDILEKVAYEHFKSIEALSEVVLENAEDGKLSEEVINHFALHASHWYVRYKAIKLTNCTATLRRAMSCDEDADVRNLAAGKLSLILARE